MSDIDTQAFRLYLELTKDNPMRIPYNELSEDEKKVIYAEVEALKQQP